MLGKFVSKKQANINKGKGKKIIQTKYDFARRGWWIKSTNFEREDKKKTKEKTEWEEEKDFKDRPFGGTKEEKPLKLQEDSLFWAFPPKKKTKWKKTKHQKQNNKQNNTFLHVGKQPPMFGKFLFFFQLTLFYFCKAVLCWKHCRNSVFSRAQLLCITDSKHPFRGAFPKWHVCNQKYHFGFSPVPAEPSIFVVLGDFVWSQKKHHFQKQIVSTKMRFLPSEHKWWLPIFLKMPFLTKNILFTTTPKHNFLGLFWSFPFPCFSSFLFFFLRHKKTKTKCITKLWLKSPQNWTNFCHRSKSFIYLKASAWFGTILSEVGAYPIFACYKSCPNCCWDAVGSLWDATFVAYPSSKFRTEFILYLYLL